MEGRECLSDEERLLVEQLKKEVAEVILALHTTVAVDKVSQGLDIRSIVTLL